MATFDPSSVQPLQQASTDAASAAATSAKQAATLPDTLHDALTKFYSNDNPIMAQRGTAMTNFLTAGANSDAKYTQPGTAVYNPTQLAQFKSSDRANAIVPLANLNQIISSGYGGIHNIVDSSTRAFAANAQAAAANAQIARQRYEDAYTQAKDVYSSKQQEEQDAEKKREFEVQFGLSSKQADEAVRQFNATLTENQRQFNLTPHGSSGANSILMPSSYDMPAAAASSSPVNKPKLSGMFNSIFDQSAPTNNSAQKLDLSHLNLSGLNLGSSPFIGPPAPSSAFGNPGFVTQQGRLGY